MGYYIKYISFILIGKMANYIKSEDLKYHRLLKGFPRRRNVPESILNNDKHILYCQNEFQSGK